jgi:hypothetical protein
MPGPADTWNADAGLASIGIDSPHAEEGFQMQVWRTLYSPLTDMALLPDVTQVTPVPRTVFADSCRKWRRANSRPDPVLR